MKIHSFLSDTEPGFLTNVQFDRDPSTLTSEQKEACERALLESYAAQAGKTVEQYQKDFAAERQRYIDDPELFEREIKEQQAKWDQELRDEITNADISEELKAELLETFK